MIGKLSSLQALLNNQIQISNFTQPWNLLTSYVRALTQTYLKVATFQSVFSRVVQRGVLEFTQSLMIGKLVLQALLNKPNMPVCLKKS